MGWKGTIFGIIVCFSFFPLWGDDWEHRLQARVENESTGARYLLSRGDISVMGLALLNSDGELYCRAGFSSPFFLVGPVQLKGVLRETSSSRILTPGTGLYKEAPEVSMDRSMDTTSSFGAVIGDLERQRYFYVTAVEDDGFRGGGCFSFFPGPYISLNFLHQISWDYTISEDTSWLTERPYPLTGALSHSWGVFSMKTDFLTLGSTLGISGGRYVPPGCYFRFSGAGKLPWLSLVGYVTVKSPSFATPSGDYPDERFIMAGEAVLFPRAAGTISAGYGRKVFHPALLPALYIESEEQFTIDSQLAAGPLTLGVEWERVINIFSWGDFTAKDTYEAKAAVHTKAARCSFLGGYTADTKDESVISAGCDLAFRINRHRVYLSADCEIGAGVTLDSSLKVLFQLSGGTVSASLSLSKLEIEDGELSDIPLPSCSLEWKTLKKQWNDEE